MLLNFWIVGTDTDVGKTCITTLLMRQLQEQGLRVTPYKPVQTGEISDQEEAYYFDTTMYEKYSLQKLTRADLNDYSFKEPASPHFAAMLEGQKIDTKRLLHHIKKLQQKYDAVICEGAGGIYVPLDTDGQITLIDVISQSQLPVVIVTRTKLGTINHTLLTMGALASRGIEVLGIVFNGDTGSELEKNNMEKILQHCLLPYAVVPQLNDIEQVVRYSLKKTSLFERLYQHDKTDL